MGTNASKDTRQVWIHKALHWAASKQAAVEVRTKRSAIEIAIAKGLGYDTIQDVVSEYRMSDEYKKDQEKLLNDD